MPAKKRILFVCMGNICRSPAAEGVMRFLAEKEGLSEVIEIDSAGTIGLHTGEPADSRMSAAARERGYELTSRARRITSEDLDSFDAILTMDEDNRRDVLALSSKPEHTEKVRRLVEFCEVYSEKEVPDPYYGGARGFEHVLDLLEDGCRGLLKSLKSDT